MKKKRILVLSGGMSNEREVSLKSGRQVYDNLAPDKYEKCLVDVSKTGRLIVVDSSSDDYAINKKELRVSLNHIEKSEIKNMMLFLWPCMVNTAKTEESRLA